MRLAVVAGLVAAGLVAAAEAQQPHQHGHGTVNIAFEGNRLVIELTAPGADIVGFERAPRTPAEEATLARAIEAIKNPLGLFGFAAAARCTVAEANVVTEGMTPAPGAAPAAGAHTEFSGAYVLDCADVSAIRVIQFTLFDKFPNAEEFDVTLLTERGPIGCRWPTV